MWSVKEHIAIGSFYNQQTADLVPNKRTSPILARLAKIKHNTAVGVKSMSTARLRLEVILLHFVMHHSALGNPSFRVVLVKYCIVLYYIVIVYMYICSLGLGTCMMYGILH